MPLHHLVRQVRNAGSITVAYAEAISVKAAQGGQLDTAPHSGLPVQLAIYISDIGSETLKAVQQIGEGGLYRAILPRQG